MTVFDELRDQARANDGWVDADTWFKAYEAARGRRLGKTLPGLGHLMGKRPLQDNARDE